MTLIRVDPDSVRGYGREAQSIFGQMHDALVSLVDDVVAVRYYGPNAVAFKTECGRMAADFANRLHADMGAMADAVRTSTSNIAASLGGEPIVIGLDPRPVSAPAPEAVAFVDVDTAALEGLVPAVSRHFGALRQHLSSNVQRLQSTDWEGNAKLAALDAVQGFTNCARQKCDAAEHTLTSYISQQVDSVTTADH